MIKKELFNLTNPQMSIYLSEQFTDKPINNIGGTEFFKNPIDVKLLKKAVNLVIKNNQAMRAVIVKQGEKPMQYFKEFEHFNIPVHDYSKKTMKEFRAFEKKCMQHHFKLLNSDLYYFNICILPTNETALISNFHHIIADAWTIGLISGAFAQAYTLLSKKQEIPGSTGLYTDFIEREKKYVSSDIYKKNKEFWNNNLEDSTPISIKNTTSTSLCAERVAYNFSKKEADSINEFCKENNISAYVLFLAAFNLYLYRTTSYNNFTIQTPVFNRVGKEKNIMGMFINMISVKMKNEDSMTVSDLLSSISSDSFTYFKNSKYPYIHLLQDLRKTSNISNYSVVFSFQKASPRMNPSDTVPYRIEWFFPEYMQDEFVINVSDLNHSGIYQISYDYLTELFNKKEVEFIHKRIKTILFDIMQNTNQAISEVNILPEEEIKLLKSFNNTDFNYDKSKTIIDLFEEAVTNYPNNIALIYKDISYTYRELNNMSNIMAEKIASYNIKNSKIAIFCKKSAWMVASLLGIMKSGNCYVPIDSEYPEERIKYIIKNSNAQLLITSEEYRDLYKFKNKIILEDIDYTLTMNFPNLAKPENLAYMIYTSGTTGKPKGVEIKHKNIVNTLIWRKDFYKFNEKITVLQIPSFAFDSSIEDIFTPLISGAKLVISSSPRTDVNIICEEITRYKVNHFLVVPSLYKVLLSEKQSTLNVLKFITIAGENFPMSLVKEHFEKLPHVRLINEYGPTENSVCSTYYELTKEDNTIFIGKPIYNCKCYILDNNLKLLPVGVKGELYVSGPGVSQGYFNREDITKERFLNNPFDSQYKMYKTGDIVTRNFSGNLEFIGRDDSQVKLRGFRIELKEIEKNILKNKDVSDAIVVIKETEKNSKKLVAYITSFKEDLEISELYEMLREILPSYMIPTIVKLQSFPLTPNGKIDKEKLPMPKMRKQNSELPKTYLENTILDICKEVLEIDNLGVTDDLFTIGNADSLGILTINSKLFTKGLSLNTQDFYKYPTVEKIANHLSKKPDQTYKSNQPFIKPKETKFPENIRKKGLIFNFKNVLLTGCTGFLGIHILDYLLKNTDCLIHCIIREKYGVEPEKRLENLLNYYFDKDYYRNYKNRIIIIKGELSSSFFELSQEDYTTLQKNIDCIINSAANTRHYGNYTTFERENVTTLKNLILFAKPTGIILNHMSTTNVSGNYLVENDISYNFTENDFYIGQNYENNVYVCSKFEAEKLILEEEQKGLKANIFRLGNLMARYSDGVFQRNKFDNAYYTRLLAFAKLGCLPNNLKKQELEFSPIDETACAIIKLLSIPNLENNIFHIFSNKLISIDLLLKVLKDYGKDCKFISYHKFTHELHLQKNEKILKYLISDLNNSKQFDYSSNIAIDQSLTNTFLDYIGFEWSEINEDYLKRFFDTVNFTKDIEF